MTLHLLVLSMAGVALALALSLSVQAKAHTEEIESYVALDGDDGWSGELPAPNAAGTDGPFATLTHTLQYGETTQCLELPPAPEAVQPWPPSWATPHLTPMAIQAVGLT